MNKLINVQLSPAEMIIIVDGLRALCEKDMRPSDKQFAETISGKIRMASIRGGDLGKLMPRRCDSSNRSSCLIGSMKRKS